MSVTESEKRSGRHVIQGEYLHKDIVYCSLFPKETIEALYDYSYKPDDIILATYPKCGTTWMQEIMYGIMNCEALQSSVENAEGLLRTRFPFIEVVKGPWSGVKFLENNPSPRLIKTHLRKEFFKLPLKQNNKIVVVLRNIKDVITSYYHYYQYIEEFDFKGHDFNEFFELFREKHLCYGDWYDWTLDWWTEKDNPNVCFLYYEDMKEDIHKETLKVAEFLGNSLTEEQIKFVVDRANFDSMKTKKMAVDNTEKEGVGQFRKGIVGDWRSHFSEEQAQYVDKLTTQKLAGTGLQFKD